MTARGSGTSLARTRAASIGTAEALDVEDTGAPAAGDLTRTRLADAIIANITEAILAGRLRPGDALPSEARIGLSFGVSKQVVREAVRDLAAVGLVQVQQGKSTRVRALDAAPLGRFFSFAVRGSATGLAEAIELRRILEPPLARQAALRRGPEDLERLGGCLARLERAVGDVPAWIEADLDFHEGVAVAAGNRLAWFQILGLRPVIREVMAMFNSREARDASDWQATIARHERVFAAIDTGDGQAAEAAMTRHFEAAEAAIGELFPPAAGGP